MTIGPKGFEATRRRFEELKSRIESAKPQPKPQPTPAPTELRIGTNGRPAPLPGGFAPLDPFGGSVSVAPTPTPSGLGGLIQSAAQSAGIDPGLLEALVAAESSFNPRAVSPAGAQGLTQLMPGTAKALGVTDPFDPAQSLNGGARYLSQMLREFNGDVKLALAAYNAGPGAVRRHGGVPPFRETQDYVQRVLGRWNAGNDRP
jgi:soluble lytic murein transglycosylase-like protein